MAADGRGSNISATNGKIKENEGEGRQFNRIEKFDSHFVLQLKFRTDSIKELNKKRTNSITKISYTIELSPARAVEGDFAKNPIRFATLDDLSELRICTRYPAH